MILLVKAPRGRHSYFREGSESLALGCLAGFLRARGKHVEIVDAQLEGIGLDRVLARCRGKKRSLIGVTVADPTFIPASFQLVTALRTAQPDAHLTIGGYAPTFHFKEVLDQCPSLDSVIRHEGEETLAELVECLEQGQDWRAIRGIAYKRDGVVVCNEPRPLAADLDALPFPARDYVPFILKELPGHGVVSLAGSRGCYADCRFCCIREFYREPSGPAYRLRSVRNIVDEMEELVRRYGVTELLFVDDLFTLARRRGEDRIAEWQRELESRDLRVMLSISDRVDHVRMALYGELHKMGVRQVMVGIEATDPGILAYFNKRITLADTKAALAILEALGIDVTITFINFTPKTTLELLRSNVEHLLSLRVNFLLGLLNRLQIYVGTPIAEEMMAQGRVTGTFPDFSYRIPDARVEVVHEVCRECLSPFLEISYEIMKVERMFRTKRFRLEGLREDCSALALGRDELRRTCQAIMEDAASIFGGILDYAEGRSTAEPQFIEETRALVQERYRLWHRELSIYRELSPCFEDEDRLLTR